MKKKIPPEQLLLERIRDSFPDIYITLISIIQSLMIGYFLTLFNCEFNTFKIDEWLRVISTALFIILVWNEYRMGSVALRWIPKLLDSIIPFLLLCGQVFLIRSISHSENWFLALCLLFLISTWAYRHMYNQSKDEISVDINSIVLEAIKPYMKWNPACCFLYGIVYYYFFLFVKEFNTNWLISLFTGISLFLNLIFLIRGDFGCVPPFAQNAG